LKFRYQKNAASAFGWLAGRIKGHRVPENWRRLDGVFLSPQAQVVNRRIALKTKAGT
jgi:hypothetical protein